MVAVFEEGWVVMLDLGIFRYNHAFPGDKKKCCRMKKKRVCRLDLSLLTNTSQKTMGIDKNM